MNREGPASPASAWPRAARPYLVRPRLWVAAPVAGAVGLVLFLCDPVRTPIYPVCLFHAWTGLDCPACGSLRALHELLHGHWARACRFNVLLVLSLPIFFGIAARYIFRSELKKPLPPIRPFWIWTWAGAWVAFGVLRNLPHL